MPYSGADDPDLPDYVKKLDADKRAQWSAIFNSAYSSCIDEGGAADKCESSAFAQANGVVVKKEKSMKLAELWDKIKALFEGAMVEEEPEEERAVGIQQVWEQLYLSLEARNQATGGYSWPVDIYTDGGELYAVVAEGGKLYRVALAVDGSTLTPGEWTEVVVEHRPAERTVVSRQTDGTYRWLSISATSVLNRVGEIDSRELFDKFVERAQETGEYPQRDFYHLEGAALVGRCDLLARDGNVLLSSGVYYDTPFAQAVRRATEAGATAGDSISYLPAGEPDLVEVADGVRLPVYRDGFLKYISALPQDRAASLFTATRAVREVNRMRDEVKQALLGLKQYGLDDETIEGMIGKVDSTNRAIDEGGLVTREAAPEPEAPATEPEAVIMPIAEIVLDENAKAEIARMITDPLMAELDGLRKELEAEKTRAANVEQATAERLARLERSDDDKRREWVQDLPRQQQRVTYRPREAHAVEGDGANDDEAIAQAAMAKVPKN